MKTASVTVPWPQGLHLRIATRLVQTAHRFSSNIQLRLESTVADARSALSLLQLGATLGTMLVLHVVGDDEHEALVALQSFFTNPAFD
jgi:phosphotransferase system HPr (HPr) family protein